MNYRLSIDDEAMDFIWALSTSRRARLLAWLKLLKEAPFTPGNAVSKDTTGRDIQVVKIHSCLVCFWADHAANTVMVTEIKLDK